MTAQAGNVKNIRDILAEFAAFAIPAVGLADDVMVVMTDPVPGKTCPLAYPLPAVAQRDVAKVSFNDPTQVAVVEALESLTQIAVKTNANTGQCKKFCL